MTTSHRGLKQRVFLAAKENLILTLYLWAVFLLLVVYKSTILAEQHVDFVYHGAALINALAFSKVILVAKRFDLSARIKDAPLIYLGLANCYIAHNSLRFPALLPFFNASSGRPFRPLHRYPGPLARTRRCPFPSCGVASS